MLKIINIDVVKVIKVTLSKKKKVSQKALCSCTLVCASPVMFFTMSDTVYM